MMYVALLRGINVGGKNKVDMKLLKETFEQAGMHEVETYINTGNVIFVCDGGSKPDIADVLEKAIVERFGFFVKVTLRTFDEMTAVMDALPNEWSNDEVMKSDALFLWDGVSPTTALEQLKRKPEIDTTVVVENGGALLWSVGRSDVTKSGLQKLIGTEVYRNMTIRNVNTTRKIYDLMLRRLSPTQ